MAQKADRSLGTSHWESQASHRKITRYDILYVSTCKEQLTHVSFTDEHIETRQQSRMALNPLANSAETLTVDGGTQTRSTGIR